MTDDPRLNKPVTIVRGTRCQHWKKDRVQCKDEAAGVLRAPGGSFNALICRPCAAAIIREYKDKLGEEWVFESEYPEVNWYQ